MRRAVAVTLVGVACGTAADEPIHVNPPPQEVPAPPPAPKPSARTLNGMDRYEHTIFRGESGCYVNVAKPMPADGPKLSYYPPEQQKTDCPPYMADPSWSACVGGTVTRTGDDCLCSVLGNPPPPPRPVACPKGPE